MGDKPAPGPTYCVTFLNHRRKLDTPSMGDGRFCMGLSDPDFHPCNFTGTKPRTFQIH